MAYSEKVADRIRERLADLPRIAEKKMMGGIVFMYKGKMCVGVVGDSLMCRIDKDFHETAVEMKGCTAMTLGKKEMIGYVLIDQDGVKSKKDFEYWMGLSIEFNKKAKASKR